MSPGERRAFAAGYRRALRRARKELAAMTRRLDTELAELDAKARVAREQVAQRIDAEIAGLVGEMQGMRNEHRRLRAVEHAIAIERDPDMLLN